MGIRDYEYLRDILPIGKENAIHQHKIAELLNIKPAAAKRLIRKARNEAGLPICSGINGYWIARDDNERNQFINSMQGQGLSRLKSAKALKVNDFKGQITLEEYCTGDNTVVIDCSDNLIMIDESDFNNIDEDDFRKIDRDDFDCPNIIGP